MNLSQLERGCCAEVKSIDNSCKIKHRLLELGFLGSVRVKCVRKSVFGTPILYSIMGCRVALRRSDARKIAVVKL